MVEVCQCMVHQILDTGWSNDFFATVFLNHRGLGADIDRSWEIFDKSGDGNKFLLLYKQSLFISFILFRINFNPTIVFQDLLFLFRLRSGITDYLLWTLGFLLLLLFHIACHQPGNALIVGLLFRVRILLLLPCSHFHPFVLYWLHLLNWWALLDLHFMSSLLYPYILCKIYSKLLLLQLLGNDFLLI